MTSTHWHYFDMFDLEKVSTLDLMTAGGVAKPLDELPVLGGGDQLESTDNAVIDTGIPGHASHLAGHTFHTLLRLNDGLVHVLDPVDDGVRLTDVVSLSLPSDRGEVHKGGEEEEESNKSEDGDEECGKI